MSNGEKKDQRTEEEETAPNEKPTPQNISVQEILGSYPIDRDKCRDVLMVEMSGALRSIAESLQGITQGLIVVNTHLAQMNILKK